MSLPATRKQGFKALATLEDAGAITDMGLDSGKLMSLGYDEYEALGAMLGHMERATVWMIGDWLNLGEKLFGDDFYQAAHAVGLADQTLTNRRSICSRIPRSRRVPGVSFSHHAEVAYLEPDEQRKWLAKAKAGEWSVKRLREAIKNEEGWDDEGGSDESTSTDEQEVLCTCPVCGKEHRVW